MVFKESQCGNVKMDHLRELRHHALTAVRRLTQGPRPPLLLTCMSHEGQLEPTLTRQELAKRLILKPRVAVSGQQQKQLTLAGFVRAMLFIHVRVEQRRHRSHEKRVC